MAQDRTQAAGLEWSLADAELSAVREFQDKGGGGARAVVVLAYWGGRIEAFAEHGEAARLRKLAGARVRAGGALSVSENRFGVRVSFRLAFVEPLGAEQGRAAR